MEPVNLILISLLSPLSLDQQRGQLVDAGVEGGLLHFLQNSLLLPGSLCFNFLPCQEIELLQLTILGIIVETGLERAFLLNYPFLLFSHLFQPIIFISHVGE